MRILPYSGRSFRKRLVALPIVLSASLHNAAHLRSVIFACSNVVSSAPWSKLSLSQRQHKQTRTNTQRARLAQSIQSPIITPNTHKYQRHKVQHTNTICIRQSDFFDYRSRSGRSVMNSESKHLSHNEMNMNIQTRTVWQFDKYVIVGVST